MWWAITIIILLLIVIAGQQWAIKKSYKLSRQQEFSAWQKECQRLMYEHNHCADNIKTVKECSDYWWLLYLDGYLPIEAIEQALMDYKEVEKQI